MSQNIYQLARIPIRQACKGYYLRWFYNGWHYWWFKAGGLGVETAGQQYYTLSHRFIDMSSGQVTYYEVEALRTIANTKEVYILTEAGWQQVLIRAGSIQVLNNYINGYEFQFVAIIGNRRISASGYTPVPTLPTVEPTPDICELLIGTQVWACKNADSNYPASRVYEDDEDNRAVYGGLYTWYQAMAAGFAPIDWMVPTRAQWETLRDYVQNVSPALDAGGVLKEAGLVHWFTPNTGAVDTYGFAALPAGQYAGGAYSALGEYAFFWTATETLPDTAVLVMMSYDNDDLIFGAVNKNTYLPVRFIKGAPADAVAPVATSMAVVGNDNGTPAWLAASGATGYKLDVSESPTFASFLAGYEDLDVGNVLSYYVDGLEPDTQYYYRVRSYNGYSESTNSNTGTGTTRAAIYFTAQGTGANGGALRLTLSSATRLTLDGANANFYADAACTSSLGKVITGSAGAQTFYIKVTSGTSNLLFEDCTKVTKAGLVSSTSSGTDFWTFYTGGSIANTPMLNLNNWCFENVTEIALFYSNTATFTTSISALPSGLIKFLHSAGGTMTGTVAQIPALCSTFSVSATNTISGSIADLSAAMQNISIGGSNTINGALSTLKRGLLYFRLTGNNTVSGDIANIPNRVTYFELTGSNTVTGDLIDLPAGLLTLYLAGLNTVYGDVQNLPSGLRSLMLSGYNTILGDVQYLPSGLTVCNVSGYNTMTGDIGNMPSGMVTVEILGNNTLTGDLAGLPATVTKLQVTGYNTIYGAVDDIASTTMYHLQITGSSAVSGTIAGLPRSLSFLSILGSNTISGDVADLPTNIYYIYIGGNNTIDGYGGFSWVASGYYLNLYSMYGALSSAEVDQLLIDIDVDCAFTGSYKTIVLLGGHGARTAASDAAVASLVAKGVTVQTN